MRLCSIASGSSGNCIYVGTDTTHLLVDAGISGKRTEAGLNELGISAKELDGILITHEHSDHVNGLGVLARRYGIPIYGTKETLEAIGMMSCVGKMDSSLFQIIDPEDQFCIKDITINPMHISHDAAAPVAYRLSHDKKRIGIITDLGTYNDYTVENLKGMDALLIEANHDVRMLQVGPYPYYLKQRILGERGHLSNEASGRLLGCLLHDNMKQVVLGHLSKENNMAELAYETVRLEIVNSDNPYKADDFPIQVARRSDISSVIAI
ncbi:MAG TPA: MBL fold metallo-hydrolase [Lachnospiraceae bacterium]|nr:MBL fold metallo-hydrolase [Lachnospiraceae bacterium]